MQDKTCENAAGTPCELGGGLHGHLGITMTNAKCNSIVGHEYIAKPNPGPVPMISPNATGHQIAVAQDSHKKTRKLHKEEQNLARALKNQIINTFEEQCLHDLKEEHVGCTSASIAQMFTHLCENYGKITDTDLLDNIEHVNQD